MPPGELGGWVTSSTRRRISVAPSSKDTALCLGEPLSGCGFLQASSEHRITAKDLTVSAIETDCQQRPIEEVEMFGTQTVQTYRMFLVQVCKELM